MTADASSAIDVAAAAPDGPSPFERNDDDAAAPPPPTLPNPKMKSGSRARFMRFVVNETFRGVTVLSSPRYAANPVEAKRAGTIPNALHLRYGTA